MLHHIHLHWNHHYSNSTTSSVGFAFLSEDWDCQRRMSSRWSEASAKWNYDSIGAEATSRKKNLNKHSVWPKTLYNLLQRNGIVSNGICASFFPIALHCFQWRKGYRDHKYVSFIVHNGSHRKDTRNRHTLSGIRHCCNKRSDDLSIAVHELAIFTSHKRFAKIPTSRTGTDHSPQSHRRDSEKSVPPWKKSGTVYGQQEKESRLHKHLISSQQLSRLNVDHYRRNVVAHPQPAVIDGFHGSIAQGWVRSRTGGRRRHILVCFLRRRVCIRWILWNENGLVYNLVWRRWFLMGRGGGIQEIYCSYIYRWWLEKAWTSKHRC